MKILGEISPFELDKKLVLSLDKRWKNYFDSNQNFKVVINENKIMLIGPKLNRDPTTDSNQPSEEGD